MGCTQTPGTLCYAQGESANAGLLTANRLTAGSRLPSHLPILPRLPAVLNVVTRGQKRVLGASAHRLLFPDDLDLIQNFHRPANNCL